MTLAASTTTVSGPSAPRSSGQLAAKPGCSGRSATCSTSCHTTSMLSPPDGCAVNASDAVTTTVT